MWTEELSIGFRAVLTGCIVGDNAHILGKAELKDSIVGSGQTVNLGLCILDCYYLWWIYIGYYVFIFNSTVMFTYGNS